MNENFDKSKILSRVRKMMALANDAGATEGERNNALKMVQTILGKYNLDLAEAEQSGQTTDDPRIEVQFEAGVHAWGRTVMQAVAQLYFCEYFISHLSGGKQRHYFFGRESNTTTCREMAAYVNRSIQREASRRQRELGENGSWSRSFCKGAAYRVWQRCKALREESERQPVATSSSTALVLASVYKSEAEANALAIRDAGHRLKAGRSREQGARAGAFNAGSSFGNSINLNRQLGNGANSAKRLA